MAVGAWALRSSLVAAHKKQTALPAAQIMAFWNMRKSSGDKLPSQSRAPELLGRFWRECHGDHWMQFPQRLRFHTLLAPASGVIRLVFVSVIVKQRARYRHKRRILHHV